jgi:hypothetical protein
VDVDPKIQARLGELQDGYLATQLLYVAARLGVADALAAGPRGGDVLAKELGADPGFLRRMLRGLAALGVLDEQADGTFGLSPVGELLRAGTPESLRGPVLTRGAIYYSALDHLLDGVRSGQTPFELANGTTFFEYLAARPTEQAAFQVSMTDRSVHEAKAVVAAYDFSSFRRLVDVGGGQGVLLSAVLAATPGLAGVLFDQPAVVEHARASLPAGCEVVGGNFFESVPGGADAYLLSRVIHNWDDEDAVRILRSCRGAMPDDGTLLMVETVLPERAADQPAAIRMDITMLMLFAGRERTEAEYSALLAEADLALEANIPTSSHAGVRILRARPC